MEITPQDLGEKWRIAVLQRRAVARVRHALGETPSSDISLTAPETTGRPVQKLIRRSWVKSARLPERDAEAVSSVMTNANTGFRTARRYMRNMTFFGATFVVMLMLFALSRNYEDNYSALYTLCWTVFSLFWLYVGPLSWILPAIAMRRINTDAVTAAEIEALLPTVRGDLDRTYLNTVLDTMRQPVRSGGAGELRVALRAIGDTISALPGEPLPAGSDDPEALRLMAEEKQRRADSESDSLVRDSLLRQAESATKQAAVVEQSAGAVKRSRARFDEAAIQMGLLRSVLNVYASPDAAAHLGESTARNESVLRVAGEATSSAKAKRELDDIELTSLYGQPIPEAQVARVGNGAPAPKPPSAPVGPWWRGGNGGTA